MKKPKALPVKAQIKQYIKTLFDMLQPGDQLRTEDVYKYCKRMTGKQFYPDTAIRYLREMRQNNVLNYTCINKQERIIRVLSPGEVHSL